MILRQRPRRASLIAPLAFAVRGVVMLSELEVVRGVVWMRVHAVRAGRPPSASERAREPESQRAREIRTGRQDGQGRRWLVGGNITSRAQPILYSGSEEGPSCFNDYARKRENGRDRLRQRMCAGPSDRRLERGLPRSQSLTRFDCYMAQRTTRTRRSERAREGVLIANSLASEHPPLPSVSPQTRDGTRETDREFGAPWTIESCVKRVALSERNKNKTTGKLHNSSL